MKNIFHRIMIYAVTAAISASLYPAAFASEDIQEYQWGTETEEVSAPLMGTYSLGSEASLYSDRWTTSSLENLYDGDYSTRALITYVKPESTSRNDNHYIQIDFEKPYALDNILLGIDSRCHDARRVSHFSVDYLDPETNEWIVDTNANHYDANWAYSDENDIIKNKRAYTADLGGIETTSIRIYVTNAYVISGSNCKFYEIDELVVFGKRIAGVNYDSVKSDTYNFQFDNKNNGQLKAEYSLSSGDDAACLTDGYYNTYIQQNIDNDYIELSFGDRLMEINSIDLGVPAYEEEKRPSKISIEYFDNDRSVWVDFGEYTLEYENMTELVDNKHIAYINFTEAVETNSIRITPINTAGGKGEYIISELIANGCFIEITNFFKLEGDYIIGFEPEKWSTSIGSLGDGSYDGGVACNSVDYENGVYGEDYHILMTFGGKIAQIKALKIGSNTSNFDSQSVTSIRVDYYNAAGDLVRGETHTLSYYDVGDGKCADVMLNEPIETNMLRVQILTSKRTYRLFKLSELEAYGVLGNDYVVNSLSEAVITYNNSAISEMTDGNFESSYTSGKTEVSEENPYIIEIDFDEEKYLSAFEIMTKNADKFGITDMRISYENDGEWIGIGEYEFTYNSARATNGIGIIERDVEILADKLRFEVTGVQDGAAQFKINELKLKQEDLDSVPEYEQARLNFKFKHNYAYYSQCLNMLSSVPETEREEYAAAVEEYKNQRLAEQYFKADYDVSNRLVVAEGYVFENAGECNIIFTPENGDEFFAAANISASGRVSAKVSFADKTDMGNVSAKLKTNGGIIDGNSFYVREPHFGCELYSLSVDGVNAQINGTLGTLILPYGSILSGRIPVFEISDGASLCYNGETLVSGESTVNLESNSSFVVKAEAAGVQKEYTITVDIAASAAGQGGGGVSGGGTLSSKNKSSTSGAIISANNTITAEGTDAFSDVPRDFWGYDSIMKLYKKGIVNGVEDNVFAPNEPVTRAQFIKMLSIAMKIDESDNKTSFSDAAGHWCEKYIAAAVDAGIVNGISETCFGAESNIMRQDMAVMIMRATKSEEYMSAHGFSDDDEIADYAKTAVNTLKARGILQGDDSNMFHPQSSLTRAEAASVIARIAG